MSNWRKKLIGKAIEFNPKIQLVKGTTAKKVPMSCIGEFQRKINGFEIAKYSSGPKFMKDDILLAKINPSLENGKAAKVDILQEGEVGFGSTEFIVLRETDCSDSNFIYYLVLSPTFRKRAIGCMEGTSGRRRVNENALKFFELPFPEKLEQQKIGKILSDLDAKIELNNKINAELEAMTKLIFDYWFVQFDFPDVEGKPYKSSGGKMVYSETLKREIPFDWEVVELKDCLKPNRGVSYSSKDIDGEGIPMINLNSFNTDSTYKPDGIKFFSGVYNNSKVLKPLDLVMCNTQQTAINPKTDIIGKSFLIPDIFEGDIVSSHHITTIKIEKDNLKYYLNTLFNTEYFHRYISGYATGTNIMGLDFFGVSSYKTEIPNDELLNKYKSLIINVENQKSIAIRENQKLTSLRDWLLPMLINGQVKVVQTEKDTLKELFPDVNLYAEVATLQFLDKKANGFSHGKTYIQKTMSHLKDIKREKRLEHVEFEEYHWGMFSKTVAKSIDSNPFLYQGTTPNGKKVCKVKTNKIKELTKWMALPENQDYIQSVVELIALYQEPLIGNNIDRIELLNTVHRCMSKLNSDKLVDIRNEMKNWKMRESSYKNKFEKFTENETLHMIGFVKENCQ